MQARRTFLRNVMGVAGGLVISGARTQAATTSPFQTRGIVLDVVDLATLDWPQRAADAGLTTIGTHITPSQVAAFIQSDKGQAFLAECARLDVAVEHELHALSDLLPRSLFEKNPGMFRMDADGNRVQQWNCCVHSPEAVEIICGNAVKYAEILRPTTGRYFFWMDDGQPMCACPQCRGYSDADLALILENAIVKALRGFDDRAMLAHLAYYSSIKPPTQVKPEAGIFLEFAPFQRVWDQPLSNHEAGGAVRHGDYLEYLDANLEVFDRDTAQVLEYWMDDSLFSNWKRDQKVKLPWRPDVMRDDLRTYHARGIRHVTSFGVYLDGDYAKQYGEPPIKEYGACFVDFQNV